MMSGGAMTGQGSGRTLSGRRAGGAPRRQIIQLIDFLNRRGKAWACRVVQLTGQASTATHPKHLWNAPWNDVYLTRIGPEDVVLDLGCGTGRHAVRVLARGAIVAAMDQPIPRPPDLPGRIHYAGGDAVERIPWSDGFFTVVLALDVIEHVEGRQRLLREIHRVLKPDGHLLATVPNGGTRWRHQLRAAGLDSRQDPDHKVEYPDAWAVRREFWSGGFIFDQTYPIVYDTPWAGLLDLAGALCPPFYRVQARWKRRRALAHPGESTGFAVVARPA